MRHKLVVLALIAFALPLALTGTASAATFTVTTTVDGGPGSLRQAVLDANVTPGLDTIILGEGLTYELTDVAGELASNLGALTIEGNGSTIVQTVAGVRVLSKGDDTDLTLNDVTIAGGSPGDDGGGVSTDGNLTLVNSFFVGNVAGAGGGAAIVGGNVTMIDSTVALNQATTIGGGISSRGTVSLDNSTISANSADADGGGVVATQVDLEFSTIVNNEAPVAAQIDTNDLSSFGSVVALPLGAGDNCFVDGTTTSGGYNFSDDASCGFTESTDMQNAGDPLLNPLGFEPNDPVGDTPVHLPDSGSPLINKIPVADARCGGTDQRGIDRPQSDGCDIGSVEARPIVASPGTFSTPKGVPITMDLVPLVDDPDNLWFGGHTEIHWTSNIGDATLGDNADDVSYTPAADFTGPAVIDYTVCSAADTICSSSTLTIDVTGPAAPLPVTPLTPVTPAAAPVTNTPAFTG